MQGINLNVDLDHESAQRIAASTASRAPHMLTHPETLNALVRIANNDRLKPEPVYVDQPLTCWGGMGAVLEVLRTGTPLACRIEPVASPPSDGIIYVEPPAAYGMPPSAKRAMRKADGQRFRERLKGWGTNRAWDFATGGLLLRLIDVWGDTLKPISAKNPNELQNPMEMLAEMEAEMATGFEGSRAKRVMIAADRANKLAKNGGIVGTELGASVLVWLLYVAGQDAYRWLWAMEEGKDHPPTDNLSAFLDWCQTKRLTQRDQRAWRNNRYLLLAPKLVRSFIADMANAAKDPTAHAPSPDTYALAAKLV